MDKRRVRKRTPRQVLLPEVRVQGHLRKFKCPFILLQATQIIGCTSSCEHYLQSLPFHFSSRFQIPIQFRIYKVLKLIVSSKESSDGSLTAPILRHRPHRQRLSIHDGIRFYQTCLNKSTMNLTVFLPLTNSDRQGQATST